MASVASANVFELYGRPVRHTIGGSESVVIEYCALSAVLEEAVTPAEA